MTPSAKQLNEDLDKLTDLHDCLQQLKPIVRVYCSHLGEYYLNRIIDMVYNEMRDTQSKLIIERELGN